MHSFLSWIETPRTLPRRQGDPAVAAPIPSWFLAILYRVDITRNTGTLLIKTCVFISMIQGGLDVSLIKLYLRKLSRLQEKCCWKKTYKKEESHCDIIHQSFGCHAGQPLVLSKNLSLHFGPRSNSPWCYQQLTKKVHSVRTLVTTHNQKSIILACRSASLFFSTKVVLVSVKRSILGSTQSGGRRR